MTKKLGALALALAALVVVGGAGAGSAGRVAAQTPPPPTAVPSPTATPVTTGNFPVIAISPELCFLLVAIRVGPANAGQALACFGLDGGGNLRNIATILGAGPGALQPSDFASIELSGNQIHQMDDYTGANAFNGSLFLLAFVPAHGPTKFRTNLGVIIPPGTIPGDPTVGQTWYCDASKEAACDPSGSGGEGVVVARLAGRYGANIPPIGPGTVTIQQASSDTATINFRVVGEPRTLKFTVLKSTIQDGLTDLATQCPLPGNAAGFLGAEGTPERAIVLAIAQDIDGNAVTGAIINWSTDDPTKAQMAAGLTPSLDLGAFGYGAPNVICGTTNPGTVTVKASISNDVVFGSTDLGGVDPGALPATLTTQFTVAGVPATMTLAADPPTVPCDGVATSKVTATVLDATGSPVAAGQPVNFSVQVLGTADPVNATTDGKGVATSTIAPLSGGAQGVPVVVTSGNVSNSVLIACSPGAPGAAAPPSGAPQAGGAAGVGTILGPNTGTGGHAQVLPSGGMPLWADALILAVGAVLVAMSSALATARTKRR